MLEMTMKRLQMNLKFLNYYWGEIDGIKGTQTIRAIQDFQADNGLVIDGIAGQKTIDCLREIICEIQYIIGASVDGVAGNETIEKTKIWQENHGLKPDGIAGINTRNAMFNESDNWNFPHFSKDEFTCKCGCGLNNIDKRLVQILEDIRYYFGGKPIIITSGTRCDKHNAEVGGVQGSRHLIGKAVDFYIQGVPTSEVLKYCQELVNRGILRYTYTNNSNMSGAIHIDIN